MAFGFYVMSFFLRGRSKKLISSSTRAYEMKNKTKVITLIHKKSDNSVVGSLFESGSKKSLDLNEAKDVVESFKKLKGDEDVSLIINSPGGSVCCGEMIVNAIQIHQSRGGKVTAYVPLYAFSGGALIAMACDKLVMTEFSVLGPFDPQIASAIMSFAATSILHASNQKGEHNDLTHILANEREKAMSRIRKLMDKILEKKSYPDDKKAILKEKMTSGNYNHDQTFTVPELKEWGLDVETNYPKELEMLFPC